MFESYLGFPNSVHLCLLFSFSLISLLFPFPYSHLNKQAQVRLDCSPELCHGFFLQCSVYCTCTWASFQNSPTTTAFTVSSVIAGKLAGNDTSCMRELHQFYLGCIYPLYRRKGVKGVRRANHLSSVIKASSIWLRKTTNAMNECSLRWSVMKRCSSSLSLDWRICWENA